MFLLSYIYIYLYIYILCYCINLETCSQYFTHTGTDLPDILRAINQVSDWFSLGIFLNVGYSTLETIKRDYPSDHNHCRQKMLISWISSGNATWSILVKTLRDDMNEPGLAERIEEEHLR